MARKEVDSSKMLKWHKTSTAFKPFFVTGVLFVSGFPGSALLHELSEVHQAPSLAKAGDKSLMCVFCL